jgi:hypothetical protein
MARSFISVCARRPDPQVLCMTYADNGRQAGGTVVVTGNYQQYGPDYILLDPCLHSLVK